MASKEVCFYPRFHPRETGGVSVHIRGLCEQLAARGWTITDTPSESTIVHCHAQARAPEVDVYTNHGIYPLREQMPAWQRSANSAIFDNLKLAGDVIAVSRWTANQWRSLVGREPHVIYNAIDLRHWQRVPKGRWRGRLEIDRHVPLVIWGKTGINEVLDPTPMIEMALRHPTWRFVAPLPVNSLFTVVPNITLVGAQPFKNMQMLLADCDVYMATVCENHSIQVLEAMALGKPIAGYKWGGTAETVADDCAVLAEPHDLAGLSASLDEAYERRDELGKASKERVAANFTADKQIDQLLEVYVEAQARKGRKPGSKTQPIKCSIIIPVYNKEAWVAETVESALRQVQAPKYEIIIVNDGSTDDSLAEARRAAAGHNNVHVFDIPNGGVSAARNFGISHAKGEYITCLDADDLIDPHFLQRLSSALDADPGLGIAYSDFVAFGTDRNGMPFEAPITCDEYDFAKLQKGNILPCCNMFRKVAWERVGGYKPINPSWEDYELWLNMGKHDWYGKRIPGMLFWYRKVPQVGRDHESQGQEWYLRAIVNRYHRDLYQPLISVVIPCYKYSRFLRDAIDSVVTQTFVDWEVVVVDDGNEDEEARLIAEIIANYDDPDIRLVRLDKNSGLANARNAGIEMAKGTWIVPLDADDRIAPTFLQKTLRATNLDPKKFAYCNAILWYPDSDQPDKLLQADEYDFDKMISHISWGCTIMYAKEAWRSVGGYKPEMSEAGGWEDWEYAINMGVNGICGVHVDEALFYYRQHSDNQMRVRAEANKPGLQETLRRKHARIYEGWRPPMCCGGNRTSKSSAMSAAMAAPAARNMPVTAARATVVAQEADVLVRYVGNRVGPTTFAGPSGRRYRFSRTEPVQKVARIDADFFASHGDFQRMTA